MGEVNNTEEEMLTAEEVGEWVDEALDEMTNELSNLFIVMDVLNEGITRLISEVPVRQKFQGCFTALNLFVIPSVLSIGISWTVGFQQNSSIETIIMFLMCLSMFIGLPYYLFSIWNAYFADTTMENELTQSARHVNSEWKDGDDKIKEHANNSSRMLPVFKDSIQRFSEISRTLNQRLRYNIRLELERIINEVEEVESADAETKMENNNNEISKSNEQEFDSDCCSNSVEPFQQKAKESRGVQIFVLNNTQDLTVEIEKDVIDDTQDLTFETEKRGDVLNNDQDQTVEMEKKVVVVSETEENEEGSAGDDLSRTDDSRPSIRAVVVK